MRKPDTIMTNINKLLSQNLNDSQLQFVKGLKRWYKAKRTLSDKQMKVLQDISQTVK